MAEVQSDEKTQKVELDYLPISDLSVLGGTVPTATGRASNVFISVTVMDADDEPITVTYGLSPWEAIRLGISLGEVAITTVETAIEAQEFTPSPPPRSHSPYL
jgi:hypothetical protein